MAAAAKEPVWRRYFLTPLAGQLKQGAEPEKLAQSLSWGFALGVFPILGTTTTLCGMAAVGLKLNHIAIQLMNWLVYPLQILLIIPFLTFGNFLFGITSPRLSLSEITAAFERNFWGALQDLGGLAARGVVGWLVISIPLVYLLARLLTPLMVRLSKNIHDRSSA